MNVDRFHLTGIERHFDADEIIVSKTNLKGKITYANQVFCRVADYSESQLLGMPHNIVRHPHMPRSIFSLLWKTIAAGNEIFAYVLNRARNGDHYWVFAHVTPTFGAAGEVTGFHSNRRVAPPSALKKVEQLYHQLRTAENLYTNPREQVKAGLAAVTQLLQQQGMTYEQFVWTL